MSKAGQADAVGGVFRVVAATWIAVHALRERPIVGLDLPSDVFATRFDLETNDPTDDLVVSFSDGRRAFISAKRAVGDDAQFRQTVAAWGRQVGELGAPDLLVLAAEELRGVVRGLDSALRRRRSRQPVTRSVERRALEAITSQLPPELHSKVLDRARVLHLPSATGASQARALLEALADNVVQDGNGVAAVAVLADEFSRKAGSAGSTSMADWIEVLDAAGHRVNRDLGGPAGMRTAARLAAEAAYRSACLTDQGRIDLSLLAEDLPPLAVDGLVQGLRINSTENDREQGLDLLRYVRRWRRLLVVGQPGSGKSVALREIAAQCAGDPVAPVPLRVPLTKMLAHFPDRVTVASLLAIAVEAVADPHRPALLEFLDDATARGNAVLLCDGLDECGSKAPWVAQRLSEVIDELPARVAVVVATRASAVPAAGRLQLPRVDLIAPTDLKDTVDAVLVACAESRTSAAERNEWLRTRRTWIEEASDQHNELLAVPLLAILLALICADTADADLPRGRALVLHGAVVQSVERWERSRLQPDQGQAWSGELSPGMLLDGFVVLGRLLDAGATPSRVEAREAVVAHLRDPARWALSPARAAEVSDEVLRFWDEHVSVFVFNAADQLTTRSKVFAEIATAMWSLTCSEGELSQWLTEAIGYTDSDGAIALAAGLDDRTVGSLLELGETRPEATSLVAFMAERSIIGLNEAATRRLLEQLAHHATAAAASGPTPTRRSRHSQTGPLSELLRQTDPPGLEVWDLVEHACLLPLDRSARLRRTRMLSDAKLGQTARLAADAICALIDANSSGRALSATEVASVRAVSDLPLPPEVQTVHESRRRIAFVGGGDVGPGVPRVAALVASRLEELPESTPEWAYKVSMHARMGFGERIRTGLRRAGVNTSEWNTRRWSANIATWLKEHDDLEKLLAEDLVSLADEPAGGADAEVDLWSLPELGDLLTVTGYDHVSVPDFRAAFRYDNAELRRAWLDALCDAYTISKQRVAVQARQVLAELVSGDDTLQHDSWWVAATPLPRGANRRGHINQDALSAEQQRALLDGLRASSNWIAWPSAEVLINVNRPVWDPDTLFKSDVSDGPQPRASLIRLVAIMSAGERKAELLEQAANSEDAEYRIAARNAITGDPKPDPDGRYAKRLAQDPDLSVRSKKHRGEAPPCSYWSCRDCRAHNNLDVEDCPHCDKGVRPGA